MKTQEERINDMNKVVDEILVKMDRDTYVRTLTTFLERKGCEENRALIRKLIAKARALGRDYSNVIR